MTQQPPPHNPGWSSGAAGGGVPTPAGGWPPGGPAMGTPPGPGWPAGPGGPPQPRRENRQPDPGSRGAGFFAKLVLLPVLLVVVLMQQASIYVQEPREPGAPVIEPRGAEDQGLLVARMFLKLRESWGEIATGGEPMNSLDSQWSDLVDTPEKPKGREWARAMDARRYELEAAIVAAEVNGPADAVERLDRLARRLAVDEVKAEELLAAMAEVSAEAEGGESGQEQDGAGTSEDAGGAGGVDRAADAGDAMGALLGETDRQTLERAAETIDLLRADVAQFRLHFRVLSEAMAAHGGDLSRVAVSSTVDTTPGAWDDLESRHGWYAQLAQVVGEEKDEPERAALLAGGGPLAGLLVVIGVGLCVVVLCAVAASIWLIVSLSMRTIRPWFVPPAVGGSVHVEMATVFVLSFLGVQFLGLGLSSIPGMQDYAIEIGIGCQWLVLLVVFWPLVRGVGVAQWRRDLGLIAPRGVWREVGAGILVYFAGLPLLVALGLLGALVLKPLWDGLVEEHVPYTTGGNPVLELVAGGGALQLVLVYTLATIWAPLVEEIVFRGALYRHLRSRLPLLLAGPASALVFGLMHGYELVLLGPVIALGLTFAFMREWRGSLVGPIVMHALHNGTVLLMIILLMRLSA